MAIVVFRPSGLTSEERERIPLLFDEGLPPAGEYSDGRRILAVVNSQLGSYQNDLGQAWSPTSFGTSSGGGTTFIRENAIPGNGTLTTFDINHGVDGSVVTSWVVRASDGTTLITPRASQDSVGTATVVFADPPAAGEYRLITIGTETEGNSTVLLTPIVGNGTETTFSVDHGITGREVLSMVVRRSDGVSLITPRPSQDYLGTATVSFAEPPSATEYAIITIGKNA